MITQLKSAVEAMGGRRLALAAVAVPTALVLIGGSATAAALITSSDIKNQTIQSWDIATEGVGTSEIRNQTIQSLDIARGAVAASELRNGTVGAHELTEELRAQVEAGGPAGPAGPAGPGGPAGADGADGADGTDGVSGLEVVGTEVTVLAKASNQSVEVSCPEGKQAVGGGYHAEGTGGQDIVVHESSPSLGLAETDGVWNATGWVVRASNTSQSKNAQVQAYVTCALAG